jgi:hypothetical protein
MHIEKYTCIVETEKSKLTSAVVTGKLDLAVSVHR